MGRNYDKSLAALTRSLFFYGTLIVVSKNIVVNGVPGGKLLLLGYAFPHLLRKQILSLSHLGL